MRAHPAPARVRSRSRGAAMVEAVAVIPFFIVIFTCLLFVGALYAQKQKTLRDARYGAWAYALHGCQGQVPSGTGSQLGGGGGPLGQIPGIGGGGGGLNPNQWNGDPTGGQSFTQSSGMASSTAQSKVSASPLIGGFSQNLSTTTKVMCNEVIHDGDAAGMLSYAWDLVKQF